MKIVFKLLLLVLSFNICLSSSVFADENNEQMLSGDQRFNNINYNEYNQNVFDEGMLPVSLDVGKVGSEKNSRLTTPYEFATCDILPNKFGNGNIKRFATDFYINSFGNTTLVFRKKGYTRKYIQGISYSTFPIKKLDGTDLNYSNEEIKLKYKEPVDAKIYENRRSYYKIERVKFPYKGIYKVRFYCNNFKNRPTQKRLLSVICEENCGRESITPFAIAVMLVTSGKYDQYINKIVSTISENDETKKKISNYFNSFRGVVKQYMSVDSSDESENQSESQSESQSEVIQSEVINTDMFALIQKLVEYQKSGDKFNYFDTLEKVNVLSKEIQTPLTRIDNLRFTLPELKQIRLMILGSEVYSTAQATAKAQAQTQAETQTQAKSEQIQPVDPLTFPVVQKFENNFSNPNNDNQDVNQEFSNQNDYKYSCSNANCDVFTRYLTPDVPSLKIDNPEAGAAFGTIVDYSHYTNYAMSDFQRWGSIRLTKILNYLLDKKSNPNPIIYNNRNINSPKELISELIKTGHRVELQEVQTYANFISYKVFNDFGTETFEKDSILPVFVSLDKNNYVPLSHKEYDLNIVGPDVIARVTFFLGMNGAGFWSVTGLRPLWSNARIISVISTLDDNYSLTGSAPSARAILTVMQGIQEYYREIKNESSILLSTIQDYLRNPDLFIENLNTKYPKYIVDNIVLFLRNYSNMNNSSQAFVSHVLDAKELADDGYGFLGTCVDSAAFIYRYLIENYFTKKYEYQSIVEYLKTKVIEFPLFRAPRNVLGVLGIKETAPNINPKIFKMLSELPHDVDNRVPNMTEFNERACAMRNTTYDRLAIEFNQDLLISYKNICEEHDNRYKGRFFRNRYIDVDD